MTSLIIQLPDELAKRVEKTGILKSPEVIRLLEEMAKKAEQKQSPSKPRSIVDALSMQGLSEIDVDFPKLNIVLKPAEFD